MKLQFRSGEKRSELSALLMVVSVLAVGALAKFDASMQLFHLAH